MLYNRGLAAAMLTVEAVRTAQGKFGKKPLTGEQVRWGIENLNIDQKRLSSSASARWSRRSRSPATTTAAAGWCASSSGTASKWKSVSDWINGDSALVRKMVEESAAKYAKEKGITPGCLKG